MTNKPGITKLLTPKELSHFNLLFSAIKGLKVVTFLYRDDDEIQESLRKVEPFLIGDRNESKITNLCGWCLNVKKRNSNNPMSWRIYELEKINGLQILDESFLPQIRK